MEGLGFIYQDTGVLQVAEVMLLRGWLDEDSRPAPKSRLPGRRSLSGDSHACNNGVSERNRL